MSEILFHTYMYISIGMLTRVFLFIYLQITRISSNAAFDGDYKFLINRFFFGIVRKELIKFHYFHAFVKSLVTHHSIVITTFCWYLLRSSSSISFFKLVIIKWSIKLNVKCHIRLISRLFSSFFLQLLSAAWIIFYFIQQAWEVCELAL